MTSTASSSTTTPYRLVVDVAAADEATALAFQQLLAGREKWRKRSGRRWMRGRPRQGQRAAARGLHQPRSRAADGQRRSPRRHGRCPPDAWRRLIA
ncbi:DUF6207 family protein [Streptomyces sp. NPDC048420]|uniref:DUF6207 family protein n=1 Tax=Streptomyces sp. NPDC048420 TaxID=3155755 RepID=UPI003416F6CE